uniref:Candidate secreted effector n=1 Tax=Meloidogyne incognita TaxID=6306 RepID=A0A914LTB1_MELIC
MTPKLFNCQLIDFALLISYRHRHHSGLSGGGAINLRENDVRKNKIPKEAPINATKLFLEKPN